MRIRVRIQPYVSRELQQRVRAWAAAQNLTESSVTEAALAAYLDDGRTERDIVARRLDLLNQSIARLQGDLDLLANAFGGFVRRLFIVVGTPAGPDKSRREEDAYQAFLRGVLDDGVLGGRFLGDIRRARSRGSVRPPGPTQNGGR